MADRNDVRRALSAAGHASRNIR